MLRRILVIAKDGPLAVLASWLNCSDFDVTICSVAETARRIIYKSTAFPFTAVIICESAPAVVRLVLERLSHRLTGLVCVVATERQFNVLPSSGRLRRLEPTDDVISATAKIERWLLDLE